jgi:hypothetical protein
MIKAATVRHDEPGWAVLLLLGLGFLLVRIRAMSFTLADVVGTVHARYCNK